MSSEQPQINMGPLLDVVFILLLFFMVSTSFINERSLPIERPKSSTADNLPAKTVRLYLTAGGTILLEGQEVSRWLLADRLGEIAGRYQDHRLLLVSDKRLPSGELIAVADICRRAGFTQLAVATEEE